MNIYRTLSRWLLISLCYLGIILPCIAQEALPLTLTEAFDIATQNNLGFQSEKSHLDVLEAEIVSAGAINNPSLITDSGTAERTYRLGLEQMIELGGKRSKRITLAKTERDRTRAVLECKELTLRVEVRKAYGQLYVLQRQLKVLHTLLEEHRQALVFEKASVNDVRLASIALSKAENGYADYALQEITALHRLNTLLNRPIDSQWKLETPTSQVFPQKLENLINQALANRPEVSEVRLHEQALLASLRLEQANRIPDMRVTAGPDFTTSPGPGGEVLGVFVMTSTPVPVFNRQLGPIARVRAEQKQLLFEAAELKSRIIQEVADAYEAVKTSQQTVLRYETAILPIIEMTMKSDRSSKVLKEYIDLQFEYLQALIAYQDALSNLELSLGSPMTNTAL